MSSSITTKLAPTRSTATTTKRNSNNLANCGASNLFWRCSPFTTVFSRSSLLVALSYLFSSLLFPLSSNAAEYQVISADSVFAVVTHKAGIASALAHDHIVYPTDYSATISGEPGNIDAATFRIEFPVKNLRADEAEQQKRWQDRLRELAILDGPFKAISDEDRAEVSKSMLGPKQLDAENHASITAELKSITEKEAKVGEETFTHEIRLSFTVHGKAVERDIPALIRWKDDILEVEAVGEFKFTEFGIKPYSAFLGSVKNKDNFHLYVSLKATAKQKT